MVTLDFETYYDRDFSLSKMSTESYIRSPRFEVIGVSLKKDDGPIEWFSGDDATIKRALEKYDCANQTCVAHNAVFDMAIMNWRYGISPKRIIDTLSMARPVIGMTKSCSLRSCAEHFGLGEKGTEVYNTIGKHLKDFTAEELDAFGKYCQNDVQLTYDLLPHLLSHTTKEELYLIDLTMRMYTEPTMELNEELLASHLEKIRKEKAELLRSVGAEDRDAFMSNDRFAELLRAEGVEPPTKISEATGKEAYAFAKTDAGFKRLLDHPNERVQALASARLGLKSTIEETRTEAFLGIARRGPFPVMLNYYGAANTGRFSGGDRTNPQNLPRGGVLRESIHAPEGYMLVACDSSQVEARTLAWFAGQNDLVQGFANNEDIYSVFASSVYNKPINKHDHPEQRHVGKTCILGLGYGVGHAKLRDALKNGFISIDLPAEECQRIVNLYRSMYSNITLLWRECNKVIANMYAGRDCYVGVGVRLPVNGAKRQIMMPNGMALDYPDIQMGISDRGFKEYTYQKKRWRQKLYGGALTENLIQALARTIVSYQMCKIAEFLKRLGEIRADGKIRKVAHMVHDEVIVVVPEEEADLVEKAMVQIMSTPPAWAPTLPVACEAGKGKTYVEAK